MYVPGTPSAARVDKTGADWGCALFTNLLECKCPSAERLRAPALNQRRGWSCYGLAGPVLTMTP